MKISVFPKKSSTFIRKPAKIWLYHSWYWVELVYLEKKSFWRPSWTPSWISQLAISYANLCRQFQKLKTMPNILVYDTSCSTGGGGGGGSGLPLEIVAFLAYSHPTIINGHKNPKWMPDTMILAQAVLQVFCWQCCFTAQNAKIGKGR